MKLAAMVRRQYLISHFQVMFTILLVLFFSRLISQFHYVGTGQYTIWHAFSYVIHVMPAEVEAFWGIIFMLGAGLFVMRFYVSTAYQACLSLGYSMWAVWRQVTLLIFILMLGIYSADLLTFGRYFQDAKIYRTQLLNEQAEQTLWEKIDHGFARIEYNPLAETMTVTGKMLIDEGKPVWQNMNASATWQQDQWSWQGGDSLAIASPAYLRSQLFAHNFLTLGQLIVLQSSEDGLISNEVENAIKARLVAPLWSFLKCAVGLWLLLALTRFCSGRSSVVHGPIIVLVAYGFEWLLSMKALSGSLLIGGCPIVIMMVAYVLDRRKYE